VAKAGNGVLVKRVIYRSSSLSKQDKRIPEMEEFRRRVKERNSIESNKGEEEVGRERGEGETSNDEVSVTDCGETCWGCEDCGGFNWIGVFGEGRDLGENEEGD
jgi:hypothetical protein